MAPDMQMRWQDQKVVKKDGLWMVEGRPFPRLEPVFQESPANAPNHYILATKVVSPVNSATPPHTHGGAAVTAIMTKGKMLNQMVCPCHEPDSQGTGPKIYSVGDSWYEPPGCHHVRSETVGDEDAEFTAIFMVEKETVDKQGLMGLVVIDAAVEEAKKASGA